MNRAYTNSIFSSLFIALPHVELLHAHPRTAEADREREVILAEAQREAQKVKGNGDGRATEIYANAFSQDEEFYTLYRSLAAYRNTFNSPSDVLVLDPSTQFFKYFKGTETKE